MPTKPAFARDSKASHDEGQRKELVELKNAYLKVNNYLSVNHYFNEKSFLK